jgi:pyruvate,orthophosphate dikinase
MLAARAVVTELGGATSHAAVVSRELGRPAVVGCGPGVAATLDGRPITVDGGTGEVFDGVLPLTAWSEHDSPDLRALSAIARRVLGDGCDTPLIAMLTAIHVDQRSDDG